MSALDVGEESEGVLMNRDLEDFRRQTRPTWGCLTIYPQQSEVQLQQQVLLIHC